MVLRSFCFCTPRLRSRQAPIRAWAFACISSGVSVRSFTGEKSVMLPTISSKGCTASGAQSRMCASAFARRSWMLSPRVSFSDS